MEENEPMVDKNEGGDVNNDDDDDDESIPHPDNTPTTFGDDDGSVDDVGSIDDDPGQIKENQKVRNLVTTICVIDYISKLLIINFQSNDTETPRYPQRSRKSSLGTTDSDQQGSPSTRTRQRQKAAGGKITSPTSSFRAAKKSIKEQETMGHLEKRQPIAAKKKAGVPKTDKEKCIQALTNNVDNWELLTHRDMSLVAQYHRMKSNSLTSNEARLHRGIFKMFQFFEKRVSLGETMCKSSIL